MDNEKQVVRIIFGEPAQPGGPVMAYGTKVMCGDKEISHVISLKLESAPGRPWVAHMTFLPHVSGAAGMLASFSVEAPPVNP